MSPRGRQEPADEYESSTETIFGACQDAMQRLAILAISDYFLQFSKGRRFTLLKIGTGTGRVATLVLDNFRHDDYTINDLSPFYRQKVRENVRYWQIFRGTNRKILVSY